MTPEQQQIINEVLNNLNISIAKVEDHLNHLQPPYDYVCYWPSVFTSVKLERNQPTIVITDFPQLFQKHQADRICRHLTNGLNESPVVADEKTFHTNYLIWLRQQIVNTKALCN